MSVFEKIISCKNDGIYRRITILGIKFKFKYARRQIESIKYLYFYVRSKILFEGVRKKIIGNHKQLKSDLSPVEMYGSVFDFSYRKDTGEIIFRDYKSIDVRNISTMKLIQTAIYRVRDKISKDLDVRVITYDRCPRKTHEGKTWCYAKFDWQTDVTMIPDFFFDGWPSVGFPNWEQLTKLMLEKSSTPPLYREALWSGALDMNTIRNKYYEISQKDKRFICVPVMWKRHEWKAFQEIPNDRKITLLDFPKYKYLVDLPCGGYSGRFKALLFSGRPIFKSEDGYLEYFYEDLKPFQHYIPIKKDLSDLSEMMDWAETHPEECERIAKNAQSYAIENLTTEKAIQYLEKLIIEL